MWIQIHYQRSMLAYTFPSQIPNSPSPLLPLSLSQEAKNPLSLSINQCRPSSSLLIDMDLDQPDSHLYDDPSYWAPGLSAPVRDDNRKLIAESINNNPYVKLIHETMAFATARMVEDWLLKEADHQYDYQKRINDYIQKIPNTPDLLQGALVDLSIQMGHFLNKSQLFSDAKTVNTKDLSEEILREAFNLHLWQLLEVASRIEPPLGGKLLASVAQPLIQILPPQEHQQPWAGPLSNDRPNLSLQQPQADILSIGMPTLSPQKPQAGTLSPQEQQHLHPLSFGSPTLTLQQPRAGNLTIGSPTLSPQEQPQELQQPLAGTFSIDSPTISPEQKQLLSTDTIATHQFFR